MTEAEAVYHVLQRMEYGNSQYWMNGVGEEISSSVWHKLAGTEGQIKDFNWSRLLDTWASRD